jgi:hypothetical protein|tara:strand:+ start:254 stop:406 length:153 start_codon:yes stop_codon:yes gene_type:complete
MLVVIEVFDKILADIVWLLKKKNLCAILFIILVLGLGIFYVLELIYLLSR